MPTINELSEVNTIASGDQLPIFQSSAGNARKASISTVENYFREKFGVASNRVLEVPRRTAAQVISSSTDAFADWYDSEAATDDADRVPVALNGSTLIAPIVADELFTVPANPSFSKVNIRLSLTMFNSTGASAISIYKNGIILKVRGRPAIHMVDSSASQTYRIVLFDVPVTGGEVFKLAVGPSQSPGSHSSTLVSTAGVSVTKGHEDHVRVEEIV